MSVSIPSDVPASLDDILAVLVDVRDNLCQPPTTTPAKAAKAHAKLMSDFFLTLWAAIDSWEQPQIRTVYNEAIWTALSRAGLEVRRKPPP